MDGALLSSYFLQQGILATDDWKQVSDRDLDKVYSQIKHIFEEFERRENPDEADTEDNLIVPVLEILGFYWSRQKSITKARQDVPDFVLFADLQAKQEFDKAPRGQKPWHKAVCIVEAKRWKRWLDRGDKTDPIDQHIPSNQILRYLSIAEPASDGQIVWAILTNGNLWRLYYHRSLSRADGYVEFDLHRIFSQQTAENKQLFKVFYLLFRKQAFVPTGWRPHKNFLSIALEEAKRWEERVSESLKEKIFEDVFIDLANGFISVAKKQGVQLDDSFLKQIFDNVLILLYRILFILYAEDRDLLPVRDKSYFIYSLSRIRDEIAEIIDSNCALSESVSVYWDRLKNLSKLINYGDTNLGIPPYNGGLFDPEQHRFLEQYFVPDYFLVPAIDKLSRDYSENPPKRINYKDLSVRQIGSIYEGLLEFKLKIAQTDLGIKKQKGREIYYPVSNPAKAKIKKNQLYLTNDRLERKATGSYYTPDYIVQYIVTSTLEPFIQRKKEEFLQWRNQLNAKDKKQLLQLIKEYRNDIRFDPKIYDASGNVIGEKSLDQYRNALLILKDPALRLLDLSILDPTMGSGHFLVGAVDYLADKILEILAEIEGKNFFSDATYHSPLLDKLEYIRRKILSRSKAENYRLEPSRLDDKNLIKRIILKRCIYGVDVNPLAVELAKVSLWLHTFTIGAPLSFLDHHLKCGNSLIGADLDLFQKVLGKTVFGTHYAGLINAVDAIRQIQNLSDTDISEVDQSIKLYKLVMGHLAPYIKILDVFTAEFFVNTKQAFSFLATVLGNNNANERRNRNNKPLLWSLMETYDPLKVINGKMATVNGLQQLSQQIISQIDQRLAIARQKCVFHWKLEFPEVWYEDGKEKPDAGFDIIIGNPPYVRIQQMRKYQPDEVEFYNRFYTTPSGSYDLYILFVEKGLQLINSRGVLGYILPNKFVKLDYGEKLRSLIAKHLYKFIDFGDNQIFPEQTTYTAVLFVTAQPQQTALVSKAPDLSAEQIKTWLKSAEFFPVSTKGLNSKPWILRPSKEMELLQKMDTRAEPLEKFVDKIIVGIQTSADDVYIVEKLSSYGQYYKVYSKALDEQLLLEKHLLKPLISGEDIERYYVKLSRKLLLFPYKLLPQGGVQLISQDEFRQKYPKTWQYLKRFENQLRNRENGKFDDDQWYRLGRTQNLDKQQLPKLGAAQTVKRLEVYFDREAQFYFHNVRVNGILLKDDINISPFYLLAVLNSKPLDFYFKQISVPHRGGHYAANKQFLAPLPIPTIDFSTGNRRKLEDLKAAYENFAPIDEIYEKIRDLPNNSAVLHDFLVFLAQKMMRLSREYYLIDMFINNQLDPGTEELIDVLKILSAHSKWENGLADSVKLEIARNVLKSYADKKFYTDTLIDKAVLYLFNLNGQVKVREM